MLHKKHNLKSGKQRQQKELSKRKQDRKLKKYKGLMKKTLQLNLLMLFLS